MVTYSQLRPFQSLIDWCGRPLYILVVPSFLADLRAFRFLAGHEVCLCCKQTGQRVYYPAVVVTVSVLSTVAYSPSIGNNSCFARLFDRLLFPAYSVPCIRHVRPCVFGLHCQLQSVQCIAPYISRRINPTRATIERLKYIAYLQKYGNYYRHSLWVFCNFSYSSVKQL